MQETKFAINSKYLATIRTPENITYNPVIRIEVGGAVDRCVSICVYANTDIAYLAGLSYKPTCSSTNDLESGDGTRDLLMASLSFVFKQYPTIQGINFKDFSKITCANNKSIKLYLLSMATSQKTWYEKHFKAKLEAPSQRKLHKSMKQYLDNRTLPSLNTFKKRHGLQTTHSTFDDVYTRCYKKNATYSTFFKQLVRVHPDCAIFTVESWLEKFMDSIPHCEWQEAFWLIKRKTVESWPTMDAKQQGQPTHIPSAFTGGAYDSYEQFSSIYVDPSFASVKLVSTVTK